MEEIAKGWQENIKQLKNKCLVQMMKQRSFWQSTVCQLNSAEIEFDDKEQELEELRHKL